VTLTIICVIRRQLHHQITCVSTWIFGFGKNADRKEVMKIKQS